MNKARRSKEYELLSSGEGFYDMYDPSQASMEMETLLGDSEIDREIDKEAHKDPKMRRGTRAHNKDAESDVEPLIPGARRENMTKPRNTCRNVLVTICLIGVWISMGLFMEVAGPTLKDFKFRLNTSYEAISNAVSGRSIGKFIGVVLGGFFVDKFGSLCNLTLAFALSMAAVVTIFLPMITSTDVLWFAYLLLGTSLGLINIAGQRIVFAVWLDKAASPMHVVHLGYGVGGFIAPLLVNPFLADTHDDETVRTTNRPRTTPARDSSSNNTAGIIISDIQYPYTVIGLITAVFAFIFLIYQIGVWRDSCAKSRLKKTGEKSDLDRGDDILLKKRSIIQMINPASCANGNFCFGLWILLLLFARFFFLTGIDRILGTFLRSYAIDQLHFSKDNASYINTIFWVNYAVGRFVAFIIAYCISVKIILVIETLGILITGICVAIFALDSPLSLWILSGISGFLLGPMFPTGIAWGDVYIEMTGLAITWTLLGSAFGGLTYLKLGGYAYDKYGPPSMAYIFLATVILITVFDAVLTVIGLVKERLTGKSRRNDAQEAMTSSDVLVQIASDDDKKEC